MFERVVEKYTLFYGEQHTSTVNAVVNLATVLKDLKEYDESIIYYERALEGRKAAEGEDSMSFAMAKAMAAGAYREAGQYDTADEYLKDAYLKIAM